MTTDIHAAFEAKYKASAQDPACAEELRHFADGGDAARAGNAEGEHMTTNQLTAAEARKIAGPNLDETVKRMVDEALTKVRSAAENKRRSIALHGDEWAHGGYSRTKEWTAAVLTLQSLGYKVDFFYEERQFVNMYTTVEW